LSVENDTLPIAALILIPLTIYRTLPHRHIPVETPSRSFFLMTVMALFSCYGPVELFTGIIPSVQIRPNRFIVEYLIRSRIPHLPILV